MTARFQILQFAAIPLAMLVFLAAAHSSGDFTWRGAIAPIQVVSAR